MLALEGGLRYNFIRYAFVEVNIKSAYADFSRFLIAGGRGSQRRLSIQPAILVGYMHVTLRYSY